MYSVWKALKVSARSVSCDVHCFNAGVISIVFKVNTLIEMSYSIVTDMLCFILKDLDVWRHGKGAGQERCCTAFSQNLCRPAMMEFSIPERIVFILQHNPGLNAAKLMSI